MQYAQLQYNITGCTLIGKHNKDSWTTKLDRSVLRWKISQIQLMCFAYLVYVRCQYLNLFERTIDHIFVLYNKWDIDYVFKLETVLTRQSRYHAFKLETVLTRKSPYHASTVLPNTYIRAVIKWPHAKELYLNNIGTWIPLVTPINTLRPRQHL